MWNFPSGLALVCDVDMNNVLGHVAAKQEKNSRPNRATNIHIKMLFKKLSCSMQKNKAAIEYIRRRIQKHAQIHLIRDCEL